MPKRWTAAQRKEAYQFLVGRDGDRCKICGVPSPRPFGLDIDHKNGSLLNFRLLCIKCNRAELITIRDAATKYGIGFEALSSKVDRGQLKVYPQQRGSPTFRLRLISEKAVRRLQNQNTNGAALPPLGGVNGGNNHAPGQLYPRNGHHPPYSALREREREISVLNRSRTEGVRDRVDMEGGSPELQVNNLVEPKYRQWVVDQVEEQGEVEKQELVITGAEIAGCSPLTTDRYLRKLTSTAGPLRQYRGEDGVWKVGLRQQETGEVSKNGLSSRAANGHRPTRVNGKAVTHGG